MLDRITLIILRTGRSFFGQRKMSSISSQHYLLGQIFLIFFVILFWSELLIGLSKNKKRPHIRIARVSNYNIYIGFLLWKSTRKKVRSQTKKKMPFFRNHSKQKFIDFSSVDKFFPKFFFITSKFKAWAFWICINFCF